EGRAAQIGRGRIERPQLALYRLHLLPKPALGRYGEGLREVGDARGGMIDRFDLVGGGPEIAQIDVLAVGRLPEGIVLDVDVDGAGQRIGDDQWRGGEETGRKERVHAAGEIAIARKHRDRHDAPFTDRGLNG